MFENHPFPWFRVYAGMTNHPEWKIVARETGRAITEVLAVVLFLMEHASNAKPRGSVAAVKSDVVSMVLDTERAVVEDVIRGLRARGWIDSEGMIVSWEDRQPVKEDRTNAERQARFRAKAKEERNGVTGVTRNVTSVTSRSVTPEKRRQDSQDNYQGVHDSDSGSHQDRIYSGRDSYPRACARIA